MKARLRNTDFTVDAANAARHYAEAIADASEDAIIEVTPAGEIARWNRAARKIFGYSAREAIGKSISLITPPDRRGESTRIMQGLRRGKRVTRLETLGVAKDGRRIDCLLSASPVKSGYGKHPGAVLVFRDITRRKVGIDARLKLNRQLLTLHKISQMILSPRSLEESYADIVREVAGATGFPFAAIVLYDEERQQVSFQGPIGFLSSTAEAPVTLPLDRTLSSIAIRSGKPLIETHALDHPEYRKRIRRWGRIQTFVGFPMKVGGKIIGCLNLAHRESVPVSEEMARWIESLANYVAELTERKRAEDELRSSREQLRELSKQTQSGIEEERKRIAREIHDELGQELSLLHLELSLMHDQSPGLPRDLRQRIKTMMKRIDSSIGAVQRITTDLRPAILDDLGLGAAVEWAAREFQRRTGIRCHVSVVPPDLLLDQDRSTALFRILQEALTNVLRHAHAKNVNVQLAREDAAVVLKIRDNGIGIPAVRITDFRSAGLTGMRERVRPWDGSVTIAGRPAKGTEVTVIIPAKP